MTNLLAFHFSSIFESSEPLDNQVIICHNPFSSKHKETEDNYEHSSCVLLLVSAPNHNKDDRRSAPKFHFHDSLPSLWSWIFFFLSICIFLHILHSIKKSVIFRQSKMSFPRFCHWNMTKKLSSIFPSCSNWTVWSTTSKTSNFFIY